MWLIKSEDETDPSYGKSPVDRTIEEQIPNSLVIVDKHSGPTSQQLVVWVKEIFDVKKAGHSGTLDPKVTGVLPIALENAVKAMPVLMGLDKQYVGIMHLHKEVPEEVLREEIIRFIGKIKQLPPVKSAVARRVREREVYFFDVLEIEGKDVLFKIGCQAGTYIRKICHDLGIKLEVGAHLTGLRRTRVGDFTEDQSRSLLEIKDAYEFWKQGDESKLRKILIPVEHAILHVKRVFVKDSAIDSICHGSPVYASGLARVQEKIKKDEIAAVYSLKEELVALGFSKMTSKEMFERSKGVAVRTDRVFMEKGTYPTAR